VLLLLAAASWKSLLSRARMKENRRTNQHNHTQNTMDTEDDQCLDESQLQEYSEMLDDLGTIAVSVLIGFAHLQLYRLWRDWSMQPLYSFSSNE
jgi:hypothetical protein